MYRNRRYVAPSTRWSSGAVAVGSWPTGVFSAEARAPACYGPNIRAVACCLLHTQHLPIERTAQALSQMYGIGVSTGFLANLAPEAASGLSGFMDMLRSRLFGSRPVHVDEISDQGG